MAMRRSAMVVVVVVGCGPAVAIDGDSSSGGEPPVTSTSTGPFTTGMPGTSSPTDPTTFTSSDTATEGPVDETGPVDTGSDFIMVPDHSDEPSCDLFDDDCPRGTKCMPYANDGSGSFNATKCSPLADDPRGVGESCTVVGNGASGVDDCEAGSMCWYVDETNMGECVAFCTGSPANPICADETSQCNINGDGVLILCLPICNPLANDCSEGQLCVPSNGSFSCVPDAGGATGAFGDVCEYINVCDPGLYCATADDVPACPGSGCCTPYCDVGDPSVCTALDPELGCQAWYEPGQVPPGFETLGACLLPS